jgi:hypothetical protein
MNAGEQLPKQQPQSQGSQQEENKQQRWREMDRRLAEAERSYRAWKKLWMHSLRLKTILIRQPIEVGMVFPGC